MPPTDDQARSSAEPQQQPPIPAEPQPEGTDPRGSTGLQERVAPPRVDRLPPYRVILHNDSVNDVLYIVETLCELTPLMPQRAAAVMIEANRKGLALVLVTHRERAELYVDQFRSRNVTVTIEPAE